jgi:ERCC4-type nuclease
MRGTCLLGILAMISVAMAQTETKVDPREELETAIPEAIRLLESKDYANFLKKFLSPAEFKEITEKAQFNELEFAKQFGEKRAPGLLMVLKSIKGQTPTFDQSKKIATYEFKTENGGVKKISIAKIDKYWYILNKPQS